MVGQRQVVVTVPSGRGPEVVDMVLRMKWASCLDVQEAVRVSQEEEEEEEEVDIAVSSLHRDERRQRGSSSSACVVEVQGASGLVRPPEGLGLRSSLSPPEEGETLSAPPSWSVWKLWFKVRAMHLGATLKALKAEGVGSSFGTIDVGDVRVSTAMLPRVERRREGRSRWYCCRSMTDRLSTLEIHNIIVSSSHLDSDHVTCVCVASLVAAVGLLSDATTTVLAAFFISPLMHMLLGVCWGACVADWRLATRSCRNVVVDAGIALGIGAATGLALGVAMPDDPDALAAPPRQGGDGPWSALSVSSDEILDRGPPASNILVSAVVAALSGVAVALGHVGGLPSALAGVALSTSLLPPLVNAGLMLGLSVRYPTLRTSRGDKLPTVAAYSTAIYLVNITALTTLAFATLKFKRVGGRTLGAGSSSSSQRDHAAHHKQQPQRERDASTSDDDDDDDDTASRRAAAREQQAELEAPGRRPLQTSHHGPRRRATIPSRHGANSSFQADDAYSPPSFNQPLVGGDHLIGADHLDDDDQRTAAFARSSSSPAAFSFHHTLRSVLRRSSTGISNRRRLLAPDDIASLPSESDLAALHEEHDDDDDDGFVRRQQQQRQADRLRTATSTASEYAPGPGALL